MQGLSPVNRALTPLQRQTSVTLSDTVPDFPTAVADLISQFAMPDYSEALQPLELDQYGEILLNERNQQIINMIELALTAPSSECDPKIKVAVLQLAHVNVAQEPVRLRNYIANIINGLARRGQPIILDDVVLKGLTMKAFGVPINLSGMSAKRARFENMDMSYLKMELADFSDAQFFDTNLEAAIVNKATITNARFSNVYFRHTEACELIGNQSVIFKSCSVRNECTILDEVEAVREASAYLYGRQIFAIPDSEHFVLPAKKVTEVIKRPGTASDNFLTTLPNLTK